MFWVKDLACTLHDWSALQLDYVMLSPVDLPWVLCRFHGEVSESVVEMKIHPKFTTYKMYLALQL